MKSILIAGVIVSAVAVPAEAVACCLLPQTGKAWPAGVHGWRSLGLLIVPGITSPVPSRNFEAGRMASRAPER